MYNRFKELGVPVIMVRENDETITPSERVKRILNAYGDENDVIVISNHINAGGGDGAEVIYALRNTSTLPNLVLAEIAKEGQNIRQAYQRRLPSDPSKDYYFMQRNTGNTQAITVEYGFLDSSGDDVEQLKKYWKNYAEAVVRAVMQYVNGKYTSDSTYTVVKGDNLYAIAKKYNTTEAELIKINNLTSTILSIGQILKLPSEEITTMYEIYVVKKGDTLYSIAKNFDISVAELKSINNLTSNLLSIGQSLSVPKSFVEEPNEDIMPNYIEYIVKKGDTLYSISKQYKTSVESLKEINNLTTNSLSIGQNLKVPKTDVIIYVVKSGDSLYSIAKKYDTTVDSIKQKNNLTSNLLSIGQSLEI